MDPQTDTTTDTDATKAQQQTRWTHLENATDPELMGPSWTDTTDSYTYPDSPPLERFVVVLKDGDHSALDHGDTRNFHGADTPDDAIAFFAGCDAGVKGDAPWVPEGRIVDLDTGTHHAVSIGATTIEGSQVIRPIEVDGLPLADWLASFDPEGEELAEVSPAPIVASEEPDAIPGEIDPTTTPIVE